MKEALNINIPKDVMIRFLETALEDLCIKISNTKNSEGKFIGKKDFESFDCFSIAIQISKKWREIK